MRKLWALWFSTALCVPACTSKPVPPPRPEPTPQPTVADAPTPKPKLREPLSEGKTVADWIGLSRDQDPAVREKAINALAATRLPTVVPVLVERLKDTDRNVRYAGARALGTFGPAGGEAVAPLVAALKGSDTAVRQQAIMSLGAIGPAASTATPALLAALQDDDADTRADAAQALAHVKPDPKLAFSPLQNALADRRSINEAVRPFAAEALGNMGAVAKPALPLLIAAINDRNPDLRRASILALGKTAPKDADVRTALAATFHDPDTDIGEQARQVLIAIEAVPTLVKLARDSNTQVRVRAIEALEKLGPKAMPARGVLSEGLTSRTGTIRQKSALALAQLGPKTAILVPALIAAVRDTDEEVRQFAASQLEALGPPARAAVPALVEELDDKDPTTLQRAVDALLKIDPQGQDVLPILRQRALKDASPAIRRQAIVSLRRFGKAALPVLIEALKDLDPDVLQEAATALGQIGPDAKAAVRDLIPLLKDENDSVREAGRAALNKIDSKAAAEAGK